MYGFTLAISCCVKTSNIPSKFVKYIDVPLFKAVVKTLQKKKGDENNQVILPSTLKPLVFKELHVDMNI